VETDPKTDGLAEIRYNVFQRIVDFR